MATRLLIVEEALRDRKGHWFEYIQTIAAAAQKLGVDVDVACHCLVESSIHEELATRPVFARSRYLDANRVPSRFRRTYEWLFHNVRTWWAIRRLLRDGGPYDHAFAPTVTIHHLLAWWFIATFDSMAPKNIVLLFVTTPGVWDDENRCVTYPRSSRILGKILRRFAPLVASRQVRLAVETKGAGQQMEILGQVPFEVFPHPVPMADNPVRLSRHHESRPLVFGAYGFARFEKGSDLLKEAIIRYRADSPNEDATFRVQWLDGFELPNGAICEAGSELNADVAVVVIGRSLTSEHYQELLKTTDCVVLPYRNSSYHSRTSRIAIEAACCGIPMIYTAGGWLEELVRTFGAGVAMSSETPEALVSALHEATERIDSLGSLAQTRGSKAREHFSGRRFVEQLLSQDSAPASRCESDTA